MSEIHSGLKMKTEKENILDLFNKIEEAGMFGEKKFELNEEEMILVYNLLLKKIL